jgi:lipocalin
MFCTRAVYNLTSSGTVDVWNTARLNSVTGEQKGAHLCAFIKDKNRPSELEVGPCFLPHLLYGPYWVVALDTNSYQWAIVSTGAPNKVSNGACALTTNPKSYEGLWALTRNPTPPAQLVLELQNLIATLGFDTSLLHRTQQVGCTYP